MGGCPQTSATLLQNLASDSQHARWGEFVARYRPMMAAFMRSSFPTLDADEAIQQTLIALYFRPRVGNDSSRCGKKLERET